VVCFGLFFFHFLFILCSVSVVFYQNNIDKVWCAEMNLLHQFLFPVTQILKSALSMSNSLLISMEKDFSGTQIQG